MTKYPHTKDALCRWAAWWLPQVDGGKEWSTDSVLAAVIEWGIVPGAGTGQSKPLCWRYSRQEKMVHFAVARLSRVDADLARVLVCHYLMPGKVDDKRHEVRLSASRYFDRLETAHAWVDGALVGLNAA